MVKLKHCWLIAFVAVLLLSYARPSIAMELDIGVGLNVSKNELDIFKQDGSTKVAKFRDMVRVSPSVSVRSPPYYFGNSRFGALLEINIGGVNMRDQVVDGTTKDVGTSLVGIFGHFNPVVFYRIGDKGDNRSDGLAFTAGLGYGISYLSLDGNFTSSASASGQKVELDNVSGVFLLPAALLEVSWRNWVAKVSACFGGDGFVVDDHIYRLKVRVLSIGYSFTL